MDLVAICREEGRKQATRWLKGAIDAPSPYALTATGARNSAVAAIMAGAVSEEDLAELSAGDWIDTDIVWANVHTGVRDVITEAYWGKVGPTGVIQTLQRMFDELNAR